MPKKQLSPLHWFLLVTALLIFAVMAWAWSRLEWKEGKVDKGYTQEARNNPYLAAKLFLEPFGVTTKATYNRSIVDTLAVDTTPLQAVTTDSNVIRANDTLVLINGRGTLSNTRVNGVIDWVKAGGTLIYSVQNPFIGKTERDDELLYRLGVTYWDNDADNARAEQQTLPDIEELQSDTDDVDTPAETESTEPEQGEDVSQEAAFELATDYCYDSALVDVSLPNVQTPMRLDLLGQTDIEVSEFGDYSPDDIAYHDDRFVFAQYTIGQGRIYVSVDNEIWQNQRIHCADHALLLTQLVHEGNTLWFLVNNDSPSLLAVFWRNVPLLVLLFSAFVVLSLWYQAPRFGPIFTEKNSQRRSFSEHLNASANFLWKHKHYGLLIERLRDEILQECRWRIAKYDEIHVSQKTAAISSLTKLDSSIIDLALFKETNDIYTDFADVIAKLKMIKDAL